MFGIKTVSSLAASNDSFAYLSLNIKLFRFVGFWPPEDVACKYYRKLLHFLRFVPAFIIMLYSTFFISELIDVYMKWGNIQSVTETLCIAFTMLNMTCKMVHFIARRKQIEKLIANSSMSHFNLTATGNDRKAEIIADCVAHSRKVTVVGWLMVITTAIIWGVFGVGQTDPDGTRKLPLRAWYPFDERLSPYYEIASAVQIITICCMLYTYISFTIFYVVLIIHACGNFKIVNLSLSHLRDRVGDQTEVTPAIQVDGRVLRVRFLEDVGLDDEAVSRQENFTVVDDGKLIGCLAESIRYHQLALKFCKELTSLYEPVILVQLVSSLLIIGQVGFQALTLASQPIDLMKFLSYFGCALFELLIFCWYSDELSVQENSVAEAAYSCQWYEFPKAGKKMLLTIMIRAQRSANETANSFFNMSCQTCTTILRNSYSIFTLLNQLSNVPDN